MKRPELPSPILKSRLIPVARGLDARSATGVAEALKRGGVPVLEVTLESDRGMEALAAIRDGDCFAGAGTVVSVSQAESAVAAGAQFLVTPHLVPDVVEWSLAQGICVIPGGLTPTEIHAAWAMGVPAVKLFPASVVGPGMVQALIGPYPDLKLIPTGGIAVDSIASYLSAGAVAVGVGGWLTSHREPGPITERANALREAIIDLAPQ